MPIATPGQISVRPSAFPGLAALNRTLTGKFLLALSASVFVALCAHLSVPLPFTPVPLTFSDFAVLLVGLLLGPETAFAALAFYLAEGACGLPVFSPLGPGGLAQLFGHTGGYLLAYPFSAALAAILCRALSLVMSRFPAALAACTLACTLIMVSGTVWLGFLLHLNPARAFMLGAAPFLPGQIVKILAAAGIFASLQRWHRA